MRPALYQAREALRDGRQVEIRALKPGDRTDFVAAVARMSGQSRYRRFFSTKRSFGDEEVDYFTNVDFTSHVALIAVLEEGERAVIIGGGRYIVTQADTAELAFVVLDEYQGHGVGKALMRHLVTIARDASIRELTAEVLAENLPMLNVLKRSGLPFHVTSQNGVLRVVLRLCVAE